MHSVTSVGNNISSKKKLVIVTFLTTLIVLYIGCDSLVQYVRNKDCDHFESADEVQKLPTNWIQAVLRFRTTKNLNENTSNAMREIFHLLGYKVEVNNTVFENDDGTETDRTYKKWVPWMVDHPESPEKVMDQIPGLNDYVTFKMPLVTRGGKYIPKAFRIPKQMRDFARYIREPGNAKKIWIQKHVRFRGNVVKNVTDMDFNRLSLVQEFIRNPLLIDGRKYSMGVFVAFSSARPLRAYVMEHKIINRFCEKLYDPNDISDPATYVTDGMETGAGQDLFQLEGKEADLAKKLASKHMYRSYNIIKKHIFGNRGVDASSLWPQIYDSIRDVLNNTMTDMLKHKVEPNAKYYQYTRWDFVMDENMKLHLIEANVNPHLNVKASNPSYLNHAFYNILGSMLRVMRMDTQQEFQKHKPSYFMRDSDISVVDAACYTSSCSSCQGYPCQMCSQCLSERHLTILKEVYWENLARSLVKMVYPVVQGDIGDAGSSYYDHLTDENKLTVQWIRHKCRQDESWCSMKF